MSSPSPDVGEGSTVASQEAFQELQTRLVDTDQKMKQVMAKTRATEADKKRATLTLQELEELPVDTDTYRQLGKAFVLENLDALKSEEREKVKASERAIEALQSSKSYLERQMKDVENNFKELVQQSPALMQQVARVGL
eukprot:TRINITY_DN13998_c0_g2_i1.p1 TRINITY_DN13998_c0_g2~~TRINITY_DN13998_c0_g2_i1.p1  ORF type:complete len:139 (+),score=43.78 TRINITY_DN13998_c0_g2_i1:139-555(+)